MASYVRWPANLGLPLLKGYNYTPAQNLVVSKTESGRKRSRRRFKNAPGKATANFLFNAEQAALFEGWFHHVVNDGADYFIFPLKVSNGVMDHVVRFKPPHKPMKPLGQKLWSTSLLLEVKERYVIDGENTAFLTDYQLSDVELAALLAEEEL